DSLREMKSIPRAANSSRAVTKCFVLRANLSNPATRMASKLRGCGLQATCDLRRAISTTAASGTSPMKSITKVEGSGTAAALTLKLSIKKAPERVDPPSAKPRWILVIPTLDVIPKKWSNGVQQDVVAKLKDALEVSAKVTKAK